MPRRHCSICKKMISCTPKGGEMLKHKWAEHRYEMENLNGRARAIQGDSVMVEASKRKTAQIEGKTEIPEDDLGDPPEIPQDDENEEDDESKEESMEPVEPAPKSSPQSKAVVPQRLKTTDIAEANVIAIVPKVMQLSSSLLPVAMEVTIREWGWPRMDPGDWLDTFIYHVFEANGIVLGSYLNKAKVLEQIRSEIGGKQNGSERYSGNGRKVAVGSR